jgi:chromosomal replication initiator protein
LELPAHLELTPAWREIRAELRRTVGESTYEIWLEPVEAKAWDGSVLLLQAPRATQSWVAERFGHVLERCTRMVVGAQARIAFAGDGVITASSGSASPDAGAQPERPQAFNPRYSFDQFVIGDGNRLAHAAALAVAELPGTAYNPLFLHAPPGLGKTHLLHAIGNYIEAFGPGTTVRYTTVESFTNGFISALGARSLDRFKRLYRDADVLLIDDVQFLASKAKTEEEFFHTFNALYEAGRQLVLTCDRLPRQLTGVEERLRERFESGLVAHLAPPDHATRVAILRKRAALDRIRLEDPEVLQLIAHRVTDNIRSLEGALIRIVAHHSLTGHPVNLALARAVLDDIHPSRQSELTISVVQDTVAAHFQLSRDELVSTSRAARVSWPRQLAIFLARDLTHRPLQEIGDAFGGRNHATVLHACKRVSDRITESTEDRSDLESLQHALSPNDDDRDY